MIAHFLILLHISFFTGKDVTYLYYPNEQLFSRTEIREGQKEFEVYYENGKLMCKGRLPQDHDRKLAEQEFTSWYPNGKQQYYYHEREGIYTHHDENGYLIRSIRRDTDVRILEDYYLNGKVKMRETMNWQGRMGICVYYPQRLNMLGHKVTAYACEAGWKIKEEYYPDGALLMRGEWVHPNDEPGVFIRYQYFHSDGKADTSVHHVNQDILGTVREYHTNGVLKMLSTYGPHKKRYSKSWNDKGVLITEANYRGDQSEGFFKRWFDDGSPRMEAIYISGSQHGPQLHWHESDKPRIQGSTGFEIYFETNGKGAHRKFDFPHCYFSFRDVHFNKLKEVGTIGQHGMREGEWKGYFPNGKLAYECFYKNSYLEGTLHLFHPNGVEVVKAEYSGGHFHGKMVVRDSLNVLRYDANYENGSPRGLVTEYHPTGVLRVSSLYLSSSRAFTIEKRYNDGSVELETIVNSAQGTRTQNAYHRDGKKSYSYVYTMDWQSVKYTTYHPTGTPSRIIEYQDNGKQGHTIEYDIEGMLIREYMPQ